MDARPAGLETFSDAALGRMLAPYVDGHVDDPAALRTLWREHGDTIPPPVFLALADGLLRAGKVRMAAQSLTWAAERADDVATHGWAQLGLGWMALARGNLVAARTHFEQVAMDGEWHALLASALVGLTAAAQGEGDRAIALLGEVAGAAATPYPLRVSCRLSTAYAYLWAGEYPAAAAAFDRTAAEFPDTPLTDDARYGAAVARIRAGDRESGVDSLRTLATVDQTASATAETRGLVDLRPASVLGRSLRRYRGAAASPPEDQVVRMLDLDGAVLARAALDGLETPTPESVPSDSWPSDMARPAPSAEPSPPAAAERGGPTAEETVNTGFEWSAGAALLLAIVVAIALFALLRSRRHARATAPSSTARRR